MMIERMSNRIHIYLRADEMSTINDPNAHISFAHFFSQNNAGDRLHGSTSDHHQVYSCNSMSIEPTSRLAIRWNEIERRLQGSAQPDLVGFERDDEAQRILSL